MTTTEKLQKIKAECERLLALAEKRTPGKWFPTGRTACYNANDAEFIAACAGLAEAGWKATIAAIDDILPYLQDDYAADGFFRSGHKWLLNKRAQPILAAWKGAV